MPRSSFLVLHRRIALGFAPLLLVQALTGAALLFRAPLARAIDPAAMTRQTAGTAPLSVLAANAAATSPGHRATRIYFPAGPADTVIAELTHANGARRIASLDPGSGHVLATGTLWRFPLEAALQLHYRLMDGRIGLAVVLANAVALALLAGTGLRYWWPGRSRALRSLGIRSAVPGRARLRQSHRSGGVAASMLALFSATTGALLVIPDLAAPAGFAPIAPPPRTAAQIDRAMAAAQRALPDSRVRDVRLPAADRIDVNFHAPAHNPRAVHVVAVELGGGTVRKVLAAQDNPVLWMKILPLHTGDSFGLAGRLALLGQALMLAALAITGPIMWWHARTARRRGR